MLRVGITGGIGSGKSTVCRILSVLGIPVYYADLAARELMNHHKGLRKDIAGLLGSEAYLGDELNRAWVASRVFGDAALLQKLNELVHPEVRNDFLSWCEQQEDVPYLVEEAAILFESGAHRLMDRTVFIHAPEEVRIRRVMDRDGVSKEEVLRRMAHQMGDDEKMALADICLGNGDEDLLLPRVIALHEQLKKGI